MPRQKNTSKNKNDFKMTPALARFRDEVAAEIGLDTPLKQTDALTKTDHGNGLAPKDLNER